MKEIIKPVNSGGKEIAKVTINEYETMDEAVAALGADEALKKLNRQNASDVMNETRASLTRETSPMSKLAKASKADPAIAAALEAIIKKFGLDPQPTAADAPAK